MTSRRGTFVDWNLDTPEMFLIILDDAGAIWSAQVGGALCNRRSAKGWRVPLAKSLGLDCDYFHAWVCGLAHKPDDAERSRAADAIDSVFSNCLYAFKVDRTRLHELEEAWIPIIAGKDVRAILTYRNCD